MARQRFESSVTAISWIPSEAIEGLSKIPFELGITHYDQPPPDRLDDIEELRQTDRFREANELRAFIEVEDGRIVDHGHLGQGHIGATTVKVGPAAVRFPAVHLPDIRPEPEVGPDQVRFVQTVGGRMGLPTPRPVPRRPYAQFWPSIAWTTLALTIKADGTATHQLVGASPFPRHWIYDDQGRLVEKSGVIDFKRWFNDSFSDHTPWGEYDSPAVVSAVESELEREMSSLIMRGGEKPKIRRVPAGERLTVQGQPGNEIYLVLDGLFSVDVDGRTVAELGPGAIVGERAALEGGVRTATLTATTRARVAVTTAERLSESDMVALAVGHEREAETPTPTS
ncbi:MAG TPA: cyclic nucleotide-binding domain-containing protein [Candidatus Limnocylindrales bacterium]|nr:cyclic nucleotide-binding domain-containing protein [Candidatus Limnocylindrales bacterium]